MTVPDVRFDLLPGQERIRIRTEKRFPTFQLVDLPLWGQLVVPTAHAV
jgi:hypothetical protein